MDQVSANVAPIQKSHIAPALTTGYIVPRLLSAAIRTRSRQMVSIVISKSAFLSTKKTHQRKTSRAFPCGLVVTRRANGHHMRARRNKSAKANHAKQDFRNSYSRSFTEMIPSLVFAGMESAWFMRVSSCFLALIGSMPVGARSKAPGHSYIGSSGREPVPNGLNTPMSRAASRQCGGRTPMISTCRPSRSSERPITCPSL